MSQIRVPEAAQCDAAKAYNAGPIENSARFEREVADKFDWM